MATQEQLWLPARAARIGRRYSPNKPIVYEIEKQFKKAVILFG